MSLSNESITFLKKTHESILSIIYFQDGNHSAYKIFVSFDIISNHKLFDLKSTEVAQTSNRMSFTVIMDRSAKDENHTRFNRYLFHKCILDICYTPGGRKYGPHNSI